MWRVSRKVKPRMVHKFTLPEIDLAELIRIAARAHPEANTSLASALALAIPPPMSLDEVRLEETRRLNALLDSLKEENNKLREHKCQPCTMMHTSHGMRFI